MKILLHPNVAINLEAIRYKAGEQEFSGIGFCKIVDEDVFCYDIILLNVGSVGYSEIPANKLTKAIEDREDKGNVRLWFHRHPLEGWSMTDITTINTCPLGGIPELIKWSASIVRTPTRWIGRVDNHLKKTHVVAEVEPNIDPFLMEETKYLVNRYRAAQKSHIEKLRAREDDMFDDDFFVQMCYIEDEESLSTKILKKMDGAKKSLLNILGRG